jgi:hypothetical protein
MSNRIPTAVKMRISTRATRLTLFGFWAGVFSGALASAPLVAQPTISSDRPGLGSGSTVIAPGMLQFELGGEYADDGEDADRISLGQALVRYGVADGFELQGLFGSFTVLRADDVVAEGVQDIGLGAKIRLPSPGDAWSWSLLGSVLLPTGGDAFTADAVVPSVTVLADMGLADGLGVAVNVGSSGFASDAGDQVSLIVTPSLALPGDRSVTLFAGYAGYFARGDADLHFAEAGLTWLRGADLQLDLNGGVEVDTGVYFVGIGVARRWPTR